MRNAFDDLYANSLVLRNADRVRSESVELLSAHRQAIADLMIQTSDRRSDLNEKSSVKMSELVNSLNPVTGVGGATKSLFGLNAMAKVSEMVIGSLHSQSFLAAEAANASIAKILIDTTPGIKFSQLENIVSKEWMIPRASLAKGFIEAAGLMKFKADLNSIAGMSSVAETFARTIQGKQIGELLGLSEKISSSLATGFAGFSLSYQKLFKSFETNNERILSLRPSLVRMPTVEYYNGARLTQSVTSAEFNDFEGAGDDSTESLECFLVRLDPDLVKLLLGARGALNSSNPDRIRHFSA